MKKPKVVIHSAISLDGSLRGFEVDLQTSYQIVGNYKADIHLIGSNTAVAGIEMFCPQVPQEEAGDFARPRREDHLPLWVIPDTGGKLKGVLHVLRRFELCRDIMILISPATPKGYVAYLKKRNYLYRLIRKKRIDYAEIFNFLAREYRAKTILTDTGRILNCILLNQGLVDEISLLLHPVIVGKDRYSLFDEVTANKNLRLVKAEVMGKDKLWLVYQVSLCRKITTHNNPNSAEAKSRAAGC